MKMKPYGKPKVRVGVFWRAIICGAEQRVLPAQITAICRQKDTSAMRQAENIAIAVMTTLKPDPDFLFIAARGDMVRHIGKPCTQKITPPTRRKEARG